MVLIYQEENSLLTVEPMNLLLTPGNKVFKKANIDPGALGIILEKLAGQELLISRRQDPFLRTHPLSKID